ncbi:M-phase phosphoprotein 6 [Menidia menidia]
MAGDSVKLSKNLLRMKFMQRGLDADTRKQLEEEERRTISDEHWQLDLPELRAKENLVVEERSFVPCEDLLFGRMSFRGFNPEVEKLMVLLNPPEEQKEEEEGGGMQADVSAEEMALRYESLVASMKKKFTRKRDRRSVDLDQNLNQNQDLNQNLDQDLNQNQPSKAKRGFLKPQD